MKSNNRILTGILLCALIISSGARADDKPAGTNAPKASSPDSTINDLFPDDVIARGKGVEIKRSRLDEAISGIRANASARGIELTPRDLPFLGKKAFDHLVEVQLVDATATDAEKAKAAEDADKQIVALKKQAPNPEAFDRQLKAINMTTADLRARLLEEAIMVQVLRGKIQLPDDKVKQYYEQNPSRFEEPEQAHLMHILLIGREKPGVNPSPEEKKAKLKKAEEISKHAHDGEDFAKLVEQYSEEPKAKENHGEITITRNSGRVPKEFEAAAFSLATGQISDVVVSDYGYHIIKLIDKVPAKRMDFEAVKSDLHNYLEQVEITKVLPSVVDPLKKAADIQILDDQLKSTIKAAEDAEKTLDAINGAPPPTNSTPVK